MTETKQETLAEWLSACIAEDERNAAFSSGVDGDPAHVLAVCAAHRRIVEMFHARALRVEQPTAALQVWHEALRALALAYADRPNFQEPRRA